MTAVSILKRSLVLPATLASVLVLPLLLPACTVYPDGTGGVYVTGNNVQVPSLYGLDANAAAYRLRQYRLYRGEVRYTDSRRVRQVVVAQNPEAGTPVPAWSYVSYTLGPESAVPSHPHTLTVPNLAGMTEEQVEAALERAGLVLGGVSWQPAAQAWGTVISQNPRAGTAVRRGAEVSVAFSSGPQTQTLEVPLVLRMELEDAKDRLARHGLHLGEVNYTYSSGVGEGTVLSQEPAAGRFVPQGTAVDLTVARRRHSRVIAVPNLVGLSRFKAEHHLEFLGLRLGAVREEAATDVPEGEVVSQSPAPGIPVPRGTEVSIRVAGRNVAVAVPNVVGTTVEAAKRILLASGLDLGSVGKQRVSGRAGRILNQNPRAGSRVARGSRVNIVVAVAPAGRAVPSVIGYSLDEARRILEREGFRTGSLSRTDPGPGGAENNTVLSQDPAAGTHRSANSPVNLTIAWHERQSVRVPRVRGRRYREALEVLSSHRLKVGRVDHRETSHSHVGRILQQDPSPNSRVWEGTAVHLVVGVEKKKKMVLVPPCLLLSESKAVDVIKSKGLKPKVQEVGGIPRGRVIFQFPPPGTPVEKGSEVRIQVAK